MSIIALLPSVMAGNPAVITVSGETINQPNQTNPKVSVRFNTDGTIDKGIGTTVSLTYTQIDAATDWIIPNAAASGFYEVKIEENSASGSASSPQYSNPGGAGKGTGTWFTLDGPAEWAVWFTSETNVNWNWNITAHIRWKDAGSDL
ncbi:MAG: hypothetical protein GTN93_18175, partial [Anaerolineae bacterium]|nr:hypothetical protein [Anaerolineae bacterium]NIQ79974.1 hypothetical protein [Anaerolineae bacterium]